MWMALRQCGKYCGLVEGVGYSVIDDSMVMGGGERELKAMMESGAALKRSVEDREVIQLLNLDNINLVAGSKENLSRFVRGLEEFVRGGSQRLMWEK